MADQKDLLEIHHLTVSNELHLQDSLKKEINAVFHLNTEYPIRVFFYELGENQARYLNIVVHHIAFDGWSIDLFLKELQVFYYHLDESRGIKSALTLPELSIQYKDFALWQWNYLQGERLPAAVGLLEKSPKRLRTPAIDDGQTAPCQSGLPW